MPLPPTLNEIEDAVVAALAAQCVDDQGALYLATCELYDGGDDLAEMLTAAKRTPALLVSYGGCVPIQQMTAYEWLIEMSWLVFVVDKSARRSLSARRGIFGTGRMIEDARAALIGATLGLEDVEPFGWPDEDLLAQGKDVSAFQLTFPLRAEVDTRREPEGDEWLERININYNIGPGLTGQVDLEE